MSVYKVCLINYIKTWVCFSYSVIFTQSRHTGVCLMTFNVMLCYLFIPNNKIMLPANCILIRFQQCWIHFEGIKEQNVRIQGIYVCRALYWTYSVRCCSHHWGHSLLIFALVIRTTGRSSQQSAPSVSLSHMGDLCTTKLLQRHMTSI